MPRWVALSVSGRGPTRASRRRCAGAGRGCTPATPSPRRAMPALLAAWALFHAGEYRRAFDARAGARRRRHRRWPTRRRRSRPATWSATTPRGWR
ncbi:MAG: hypothetical protein MZW92_63075 [Comamonadaceae bacterium]|nr:hypothetical protein [Comamonadaceae bacterium]